jgi:hypothetical protein
MVTSKKQPDTSTRVVWRMSADVPLGEYVEVAPTSVTNDGEAETPRRRATDTGSSPSTLSAGDNRQRRRSEDTAEIPPMPTKVLRPAQVESWQSSSFDLLSGCRTRDVTDTIPDNVFDELFGQPGTDLPNKEGC